MAIVIDIKATGLTRATNGLEKLEKMLQRVENALSGVTGQMTALSAATRAASNAAGSFRMGTRPGSGQGRGNVRRPPIALDPNDPYVQYRWFNAQNKISGGKFQAQRNAALQRAFVAVQASAMGGSAQGFNRMTALAGPMSQLTTNTPMKRIMTALLTSRVGFGGGGAQIMPLIGRSLAALGGGGAGGGMGLAGMAAGAMNPVTAPIAVFTLALTAAAIAADKASKSLNEISNATFSMGAGLASAGLVQKLGHTGINTEAAYGAVMSGGYARALAANAGYNVTGGPFGNLDRASLGRSVATQIMNSSSEQEAIRKAMAFRSPEASKLYYLDARNRADFLNNRSDISVQDMRNSINVQYRKDRLGDKVNNLLDRMMARMIPILDAAVFLIEKIFAVLERIYNFWAKPVNNVLDQVGKNIDNWYPGKYTMQWGALGLGMDLGTAATKALMGENDKMRAQQDNTRAINSNTHALKEFRETLGGGMRAQRALPTNTSGFRLNDQSYRLALESGVI